MPRFHRIPKAQSPRMAAIIAAVRGPVGSVDAPARSTVKPQGATPETSLPSTAPKVAASPAAPPAPRQPRLSATERQKIAAEVRAELAAEAKARQAAEISALWDKAYALAFGPTTPAGMTTLSAQQALPKGTTTIAAASASWDKAYSSIQPAA